MTKEELHKIETAFEPFHRFLRDTEKGEGWHATRQQLWVHVHRQIAALVDKPVDKPADKKGDKARARNPADNVRDPQPGRQ